MRYGANLYLPIRGVLLRWDTVISGSGNMMGPASFHLHTTRQLELLHPEQDKTLLLFATAEPSTEWGGRSGGKDHQQDVAGRLSGLEPAAFGGEGRRNRGARGRVFGQVGLIAVSALDLVFSLRVNFDSSSAIKARIGFRRSPENGLSLAIARRVDESEALRRSDHLANSR